MSNVPNLARFGNSQVLLVILCTMLTSTMAFAQGSEWSDSPPSQFRRALAEATSPFERTAADALARLAAEPSWEPYLRSALNETTEQKNRDTLRSALIRCQARLLHWNLERAKEWGKELHLDYLADLARYTDDAKQAATIADLVFKAQKTIHDKYKEIGPFLVAKPPAGRGFLAPNGIDYAKMSAKWGFQRFSGDRVDIPTGLELTRAFIHANSGSIEWISANGWICLCREQLREIDRTNGVGWGHAVVVVNSSGSFKSAYQSLIVCDGDIDLSSPLSGGAGSYTWSVIIANGNVSLGGWPTLGNSVIYAAGDLVVPSDFARQFAAIMTGGKNSALGPKDDPVNKFKAEKVKNPFGVKFVSPADAGIELKISPSVVRLGEIKASSPLTKSDLRKGDRVLKLNGVPVETAADFRRQLRESLLWGTGLFEIKRGEQTFLRLVKFAEPPK